MTNTDKAALADRIGAAVPSWLPITGHVVNFTFTLDERDLVIAVLRSADGIREATVEECHDIALAIDSGRGNEKEIAKAIRALAAQQDKTP